jgi:hypothetical protein
MSHITNVVIYADEDIEALTATEPGGMGSRAGHNSNKLVNVGSHHDTPDPAHIYASSGGTKIFTAGVLLGAYNYLDVAEFLRWMRETVRGSVVLILDIDGSIQVHSTNDGNTGLMEMTA